MNNVFANKKSPLSKDHPKNQNKAGKTELFNEMLQKEYAKLLLGN